MLTGSADRIEYLENVRDPCKYVYRVAQQVSMEMVSRYEQVAICMVPQSCKNKVQLSNINHTRSVTATKLLQTVFIIKIVQ